MKKVLVLLFGLSFLAVSCNRKSPPTPPPSPSVVVPPAPSILPPPPPAYTTASGKQPQFVVMAFDGSYSLSMWQRTLGFAQNMTEQGHPVHFTYFLSGVYFLNYRKAVQYDTPDNKPGTSLIGFADSNIDVEKRVGYVNGAIAGGHEIGSHANGHFSGSTWSLENWEQELSQFDKLIFQIPQNNDVSSADAVKYTINIKPEDIIGFRAPNLGSNNNMFTALAKTGYKYDTSLTSTPSAWPKKISNGMWEFPLAYIQYANTKSSLLAMDYNFYFKQSSAKDVTKKGEDLWSQFYKDTYDSYYGYFLKNYNANRAPIFIGSHFSEWNDGVYWEAMRDFGQKVCAEPEVYCVTFRDLMNYLDSHPTAGTQK
ncbi:MAG: hypothetical protein KW804_00880 [Candidatus Doudnabacteria bacterium]|nr:hypothetical protein [Candidatus Doudnabacteria bacterium]